MNRYLFSLRVTVKDGERALLTRNGRFERVLEPGRHTLFDPAHQLAVELHNVVRAEFPADRFAVLKTAQPELAAELFEEVATKALRGRDRQHRRPPAAPDGPVADPRVLEGRDQRRCRARRRRRATRRSTRGTLRWWRASATCWLPSTWSRTAGDSKTRLDTAGHFPDQTVTLPLGTPRFVRLCPGHSGAMLYKRFCYPYRYPGSTWRGTTTYNAPRNREVETRSAATRGARRQQSVCDRATQRPKAVRYPVPARGEAEKLTLAVGLTLADARAAAAAAMAEVARGRDPAEAKRGARATAANTLQAIAEAHLRNEEGRPAGQRLRTIDQRRATFERLIFPKLGVRPIAEIRRGEIVKLMDQVEASRGGRMADEVLSVFCELYSTGTRSGTRASARRS